MMRRKIFIGLFLAAIVGLVAGEYWINRTGAQDAPKKAEPEKKIENSLYDILKKDLDLRKDAPPSIPLPMPVQAPPTLEKKPEPPKVINNPPPLPPLPNFGTQTSPPPVVIPPPLTPQVDKEPVKPIDNIPAFPPAAIEPKPVIPPTKPSAEDAKPTLPTIPASPQSNKPQDPLPKSTAPIDPPKLKPDLDVPPVRGGNTFPSLPAPASPMQPIVEEVAKIKNCPWSLHIEMIDNQTVVTATVNKKHEFKIVCQSLDLQTGKGTLKASGKVKINGESLSASCEHLAIPLMEDRLVLEGGAAVSIQKSLSNVSDARPAAFELKGDNLTLRISELEASKFLQTSTRSSIDVNVKQAALVAPASNDKKWSPFGKLRRLETNLGTTYHLENSAGEQILELLPRQGGTLDQYVGQTISVFGISERSAGGNSVVRVTHIALP